MSKYKDISSTNVRVFDKDVEAIKNSLRNILYTKRGSFPGNPLFGSDLHLHVFGLNDNITNVLVKNSIEGAISNWEKRVKIVDVNVESIPEYNKVQIFLTFSLVDDFNDTNYTLSLSY